MLACSRRTGMPMPTEEPRGMPNVANLSNVRMTLIKSIGPAFPTGNYCIPQRVGGERCLTITVDDWRAPDGARTVKGLFGCDHEAMEWWGAAYFIEEGFNHDQLRKPRSSQVGWPIVVDWDDHSATGTTPSPTVMAEYIDQGLHYVPCHDVRLSGAGPRCRIEGDLVKQLVHSSLYAIYVITQPNTAAKTYQLDDGKWWPGPRAAKVSERAYNLARRRV